MSQTSLHVTYRKGKPFAAYLYLPRRRGDVASRTEEKDLGLAVDFAADGRPIGLEIHAPGRVTVDRINEVLAEFDLPPVPPEELAPLQAA